MSSFFNKLTRATGRSKSSTSISPSSSSQRNSSAPPTPRLDNQPLFLTPPHCEATLVSGSLRRLVELPQFVDLDEWLASNAFEFFKFVNSFYGLCSEQCTASSCPVMSANAGVEYSWTDAKGKAMKCTAPSYVDSSTTQIQSWITDEAIFPTRQGGTFPPNFQALYVRPIFRHLYRILAHIYHAHYNVILQCSSEAHLNTLFAHFVCFATTFDLLDKKEMSNMEELIQDFGRSSIS